MTAEGAGKCIWIREAHDQAVFESSLIRARVKQNIANSQYLYYYFNSPAGKAGLSSILRQVAVSGITGSDLINLDIPLPPLRIQNQSAEILSAFDDKIELNRQMNRTLEQMAHALFKSWFIDFDPVHAKQRGEQPEGMDADTAALFPNRFVEVDGKEVPEGWEWQPFDTNLVLLGGGTPKTTNEEFWGGTIPWYSVVDVPTEGDIWVIDTQKTITEAGLNSSSTNRE